MFVINPDQYLLPSYKLSPFSTSDIALNLSLQNDIFALEYFEKRFIGSNWSLTLNGREGIELALKSYDLKKEDIVTILTTTQNFYISSCVTNVIEKFCNWNREITPNTKIIFVNHEFGFVYPEMDRLIELGIPIIEDCCTAFFSQDKNSRIGMYGDFSIYSFPKFFPIQIGGLIVSKKAIESKKSKIAHSTKQYVLNVLSYYLKNKKEILQSREQIYNYTKNLFETYGFEARIKESINEVPSVFLFRNNGKISNLDALKLFLTRHGIQCSVFYGEDSFYIPSNQKLEFTDVDYFLFLVLNFIQKQNDN